MEYLIAFVAFVLFCIAYGNWKKNPMIPGPFPLPIIGGAYALIGSTTTRRILYKWLELAKKYNGTMSLWIGSVEHIMISKPEHAQVYFTSHLLTDHAPLYDFFKPGLGNGLFTSNGVEWKAKRKAWVPSFHPSVLQHFVKNFQDHTDILVELLGKEKHEFPAFPYLRDVYMDCLFTNQFEHNHNSQREQRVLNDESEQLNEILYSRLFNIPTQNDTIFYLTSDGRKCASIMKKLYGFLDDFIPTKKKDLAEEGDLPADDWRNNLFLRQLFNERKPTKKEMYDEILTLLVTGYETVARATGFVLLMLGKHQDVQDQVFREDQEIQNQLNGKELDVDDLQKYEYLERVIKETLRLFPVGPLVGRIASENLTLGDLQIEKGKTVMCLIIAIHRNPEIYPNPLEFNPDNFLQDRIDERHPYSYLPYSSGPRGCIGVKYSMIAMKILLATVVRTFRVISHKNVEDIALKLEVTMTDDAGFLIRLEKRDATSLV